MLERVEPVSSEFRLSCNRRPLPVHRHGKLQAVLLLRRSDGVWRATVVAGFELGNRLANVL